MSWDLTIPTYSLIVAIIGLLAYVLNKYYELEKRISKQEDLSNDSDSAISHLDSKLEKISSEIHNTNIALSEIKVELKYLRNEKK